MAATESLPPASGLRCDLNPGLPGTAIRPAEATGNAVSPSLKSRDDGGRREIRVYPDSFIPTCVQTSSLSVLTCIFRMFSRSRPCTMPSMASCTRNCCASAMPDRSAKHPTWREGREVSQPRGRSRLLARLLPAFLPSLPAVHFQGEVCHTSEGLHIPAGGATAASGVQRRALQGGERRARLKRLGDGALSLAPADIRSRKGKGGERLILPSARFSDCSPSCGDKPPLHPPKQGGWEVHYLLTLALQRSN